MKIMIALRENGGNGGPHNSHLRIMNSSLKNNYSFIPLYVPKCRMGLFNYKLLKQLSRTIKKEKPDVIQIIGLEMIGFYLTLASKIARVKSIVLAIHGSSSESLVISGSFIKRNIMRQLEKYTLKNATVTYGVSKYVYTIPNVAKYSKNYFGHIYNMGVDVAGIDKWKQRMFYSIDPTTLVIVSTGRIVVEKGYALLVDVINQVNPAFDIKYLIVGDGDYLPEMKCRLRNQEKKGRVLFFGYQEDVRPFLAAADVFVMASYHETLCMSLIEAGEYGLAMIASNVGGMREVVDDSETGFLVEPGSSVSFASKIEELYLNRDMLYEMQKKAALQMRERFSEEKAIISLNQIYSSLGFKK